MKALTQLAIDGTQWGKVLGDIGEALADAVKKHPEKAIGVAGALGALYLVKHKKIHVHMKKDDVEFTFKAE